MPIILKIELADIEPAIWRKVVVPNSTTLDELHSVIQGAFAWHNYHLHAFELGDQRFEIPDPEEGFIIDGARNELDMVLGDTVKNGTVLKYEYDFGDGWEHNIVIEDVIAGDDAEYGSLVPQCLAGARAGPPEDCGGVPGYYNLIEALSDKKHPDHQELSEWAQGYDPDAFNIWQANALIAALYVWTLERKGKDLEPLWQ